MNEYARKQARRAALESLMLDAWKVGKCPKSSFEDYLERQTKEGMFWRDEAIELIELYGESVV